MKSSAIVNVLVVLLLVLVVQLSTSSSAHNSKWQTLDGSAPLVIARGGLSGMFPYASEEAYQLALNLSVPDVIMWCDIQLTKDDYGLCLPNLVLNKGLNVDVVYPNRTNVYFVNGVRTEGYFPIDFSLEELLHANLTQEIYSRPHYYNDVYNVETVENVFKLLIDQKAAGLWLNIQHASFYAQHNLSMTSYLIRISKQLNISFSYISSPDIGFLRGLKEPFASTKTSLVFRFLDQDEYEPSTKKSYGFLLSNLTYIKTFASAILVPKVYVWPVDEMSYLLPHTNLVADAHRNELQVFAYGFANDKINAHNYSYNPITEYLFFVDNGNFSVDGVVSDFPLTSSAARECFAHLRHSASVQAMPKPLVISNCGASGIYPGCTDLAYKKAISDGTDAIDCPVHMSKDGVPFCSSSVDLMANTFVYQTEFRKFASVINEIQSNAGIFSFSLNWSDIQALTPALSNPHGQLGLFGNPKYSKSGKIVSLSEFLEIAKNASSVSRVLIKMENARYLAENQGMSIVYSVLNALRDSHIQFLRISDERIMIQSTSSAVLKAMQGKGFELVYEVHEAIEVIDSEAIEDIKCFAHSVVLNKDSVFFNSNGFLRSWTHVVDYFHAFLIPVYIQGFRNEYVSIPYDFYYDPVVEINSYVRLARVEGLITAFPQTAVDYRNNLCLTLDQKVKYMKAMIPGELVSLVPDELRPALLGAFPVLTEGEVLEPALPPIVSNASLHHSPPPQVAATSTSALLPRRLTAFLSCLYIVLSL